MARAAFSVASDVGGHKELIATVRTGMLFKAATPALADTILQLMAQSGRWADLRAAGRRLSGAERSWQRNVSLPGARFQRLVGSPG